jgi:16S rRNA (guanine1207-N2)-methyltransferase
MPKIPLDELKQDKEIKTYLMDESVHFKTTWGLFCPEEIDIGTRLLLKSLAEVSPAVFSKDILDIGCGYGPIGISIAKKYPSSNIEMIDKDFVAIEYTQKNIKENNITNAKVYLSNGFSHVTKDKKYSLIVSNLPAKVSKEFFWILFGEAFDHMDSGSQIIVVVIRQLEAMVKKNFNTLFNNSELLDRDKTYSVISATKE